VDAGSIEERLAALEARVAALEGQQAGYQGPEECRMHTCSYFRHYLAYGPAELSHEGYHAAELRCTDVQKRYLDHLDSCRKCNEGELATCALEKALRKQAEYWEKAVRA